MRISIADEASTIALGRIVGESATPSSVVLLCGDLGAGKTRLVKGIAAGLGMSDEITSPTFNIVYEYDSGRLPLYHFDLYRLDEASQLDDIDYWGLLEGDGISAVEWGDRFPEALPEDYLKVDFSIDGPDVRHLELAAVGEKAAAMLAAIGSAVEAGMPGIDREEIGCGDDAGSPADDGAGPAADTKERLHS